MSGLAPGYTLMSKGMLKWREEFAVRRVMSHPTSNPNCLRKPGGHPSPDGPVGAAFGILLLLLLLVTRASGAENAILHLKNGDRLAGTIISEDTNRVVITNSWIKELAVPLAEIA